MKWVTPPQVLTLHHLVIQETGGSLGILNPDQLEATLARPFAAFGGQEMFVGLWSKVAALAHGIVSAHPFLDGNKRTAFVVAEVCLKLNGFRLTPSEEAAEFFWSIARGEQDVVAIAKWLEAHSV